MARAAKRTLTPSSNFADPLAAGIGGFTGSLNQALLRMQKNKDAQVANQNKQKSSLDRALELLGKKYQYDSDLLHQKGNQAKDLQDKKTKDKNPPVTGLDDLFKNDFKTYQVKLQNAHSNWQKFKDNAYSTPGIAQQLSQTQDPVEQSKILKNEFMKTNADDANILSHAATHLIGGQDQSAQTPGTSQPSFSLTAPPTGFTMPSGPATGQ